MDEIKPEHYVTEKQCQEMIDKAIDKHNKTATIISAIIGTILLGFYSHGVLALVGRTWRDVAQFGRALALGASGRRFKSYRPDHLTT